VLLPGCLDSREVREKEYAQLISGNWASEGDDYDWPVDVVASIRQRKGTCRDSGSGEQFGGAGLVLVFGHRTGSQNACVVVFDLDGNPGSSVDASEGGTQASLTQVMDYDIVCICDGQVFGFLSVRLGVCA